MKDKERLGLSLLRIGFHSGKIQIPSGIKGSVRKQIKKGIKFCKKKGFLIKDLSHKDIFFLSEKGKKFSISI